MKPNQAKPYQSLLLTFAGLLIANTLPVNALEKQLTEQLHLGFDSSISAGTSWRIEGRDPALISQGNGGTAASNTNDDGNLNFNRGSRFSTIIKGNHDLQLQYSSRGNIRRAGVLVSGKWWYDQTLNDRRVAHGHEPTSNTPGQKLDDSGFDDFAKFQGLELLDAFAYMELNLGDYSSLALRAGRHVLSWGESTFIQNGINVINPIDVSAFRRPGAEIKEGLLPVSMVSFNLAATENLSVEGFYQLAWESSVIDGCGTYFSNLDFAAQGCDRLAFVANQPDQNTIDTVSLQRGPDIDASSDGQYGLALRYYLASLGIELGAYYINYHSRLPYFAAQKSSTGAPFLGGGADTLYRVAYPEDIELFGLSFATELAGWAVSGELSHRRDLPLQINGNDLLSTVLTGNSSSPVLVDRYNSAANGSIINGFDRYDVTQAQVTIIKTFERILGAQQYVLIAEVGATHVDNLANRSQVRYGRSTVFGTGAADAEGYTTTGAWGYRIRSIGRYQNALFNSITLLPSLAFSHDVDGYSPEPAQQFQEDRISYSVGLAASYQERYSVGLSLTQFLSSGDFNNLRDRDFVSLTAGVQF